ncbi:pro-MCH [Clinocottus analis]|uniref:pro-MCH n=1 Tax=Clinocottus analis TaxID=304258 RepID=UPI0035BF86FD
MKATLQDSIKLEAKRLYKTSESTVTALVWREKIKSKTAEADIVETMISVYSALCTLVLLSELSGRSVAIAVPASKVEDGAQEQNGFFLGAEPLTELAGIPLGYGQNLVLDANERDEGGSPKILFVSDVRLKGRGIRGMNPAFSRILPRLADQSLGFASADRSLKVERRNTDIDILRCMIGRVYRPCWNE